MAKKLWGGRFKKKIDQDFFEFQKSIQYDHKLAAYDIIHSLLHVTALANAKLISNSEKASLLKALKKIRDQIKNNKFKFNPNSEDIHTDIHNKVEKMVGKLALKLHTLRSRNDQVAFDEKSYCYSKTSGIVDLVNAVVSSFGYLKNKYKNNIIVGYTHTQRAQKIFFRDYIGAYISMLNKDKERLLKFQQGLKITIGAGALAGSLIRGQYAKAIKQLPEGGIFSQSVNTVYDVSERDFIIEFISHLSILQMHLSRLAEDLILYSTKEFNFIDLPEEFCTGSSMMPHKKNPDFLELVRGYTGRIYGNLMSILTTMKGLPLTYNRDMQLDKEPLFSSVEIIEKELKIMGKFIKKVELNETVIGEALKDEDLDAVNKAEKLVIKGVPFKKAHDIIGRGVRDARI